MKFEHLPMIALCVASLNASADTRPELPRFVTSENAVVLSYQRDEPVRTRAWEDCSTAAVNLMMFSTSEVLISAACLGALDPSPHNPGYIRVLSDALFLLGRENRCGTRTFELSKIAFRNSQDCGDTAMRLKQLASQVDTIFSRVVTKCSAKPDSASYELSATVQLELQGRYECAGRP
jgi:hypothetical protein